jgi:nucleoid DNA-binding protein
MEKRITHIDTGSANNLYIKSTGEIRSIKIYGTKSAGFSIEINDSSGDCILEQPLQNISIPDSGVYELKQVFPSITTGFKEEYYTINITAHGDVYYKKNDIILYQYPNTTVTLAVSTTQTGPALAVSGGSDITVTKPAYFDSVIEKTQTLTITENPSDTAGFLYVKDNFNNSISKNTTFKRVITTSEEPKKGSRVILKPSTVVSIDATTSGTITKGSQNYPISGDVEPGMSVYGKITKDKIIHKSLDVATCQKATDRFELSDTIGLFVGMKVKINNIGTFFVTLVECGKNIKIDKKIIVPEDKTVTFYYETFTYIGNVETQINENGNACVNLVNSIMIVDGMTLDLDKDSSKVKANSTFTGSGTNSVVLTNNIIFSKFGNKNVTHTLDLDNIITKTPNNKSFSVTIDKNSGENQIKTDIHDYDESTKTATITTNARHGNSAVKGTRSIFYTPNTDFVGTDKILYTVSDGTNTSAEAQIDITVK